VDSRDLTDAFVAGGGATGGTAEKTGGPLSSQGIIASQGGIGGDIQNMLGNQKNRSEVAVTNVNL
jgi:hypothetical protein